MRWFISLVIVLSFCAQAQEVSMERSQEEISFIFRADSTVDLQALTNTLHDQGFTLQTLTPASLPETLTKVFPNAIPNQALFALGGSSDLSPCNNLYLGVVKTDKELDKAVFQGLEATLESFAAPQLVAGGGKGSGSGGAGGGATTNGEGSHTSDMASNTSKISSEASFFTNARITEAQKLAYASKEHESIIAILSTGLNLSENTGDLATMISPLQMDYIGSDEVSFDTVLGDDYEDYMEPSHLNKGQGTPVAMIAHMVAPQSEILPLRVCNDKGQCPTSSIAIGVCHAVNVAAMEDKKLVIDMSFSGVEDSERNPKETLLYDLLQAVISPRVVVAADVGNRGLDPRLRFPAAFTNEGLDGIIAVGALQPESDYSQTYLPAYYSSRGNYVDIATMGTNVFIGTHLAGEAGYDGGYSGTSFATPWIAGTLALMMDVSNSTSWELEKCLKSTAQVSQLTGASQLEVGAGVLNAEAAVACVLNQ
jgi:hypothetical protein